MPTACLLSEDTTIMPITDPYFLSEAQCRKYTLSDLVKQADDVDLKHTAARQVVTIGAVCYPMVGHLRKKDTPYDPYKRSLYALTYKGRVAGKQKNGNISVKYADGTSEEYCPEEVLMGLDEVEGVRHVDFKARFLSEYEKDMNDDDSDDGADDEGEDDEVHDNPKKNKATMQ